MSGLIMQWTFDPKTAPDAGQLTEGLRQVRGGCGCAEVRVTGGCAGKSQ